MAVKWVKPFNRWSCGDCKWEAFSNDMLLLFDLSQLARFNWLVDLEFRPLNTFVHGNDWNKRDVLWLQSSMIDDADDKWFVSIVPISVSIESVDLDDERKKFVCKERAENGVDVDDDATDCGDLIGVEVDDGSRCGGGGGCVVGVCCTDVICFKHTQRNFNLSHVGQSNLLNCNWIFC